MLLKTKEACSKLAVSSSTLRYWHRQGKLKVVRTPGGHRLYDISSLDDNQFTDSTSISSLLKNQSDNNLDSSLLDYVIYCRVSSPKQKDDLSRQIEFMREKYPTHKVVTDIGSGINFKRPGLRKILVASMQGSLKQVVVAHRDRLCRFAFDLIKWILHQNSAELLVLDDQTHSPESEFTEDLLSIVHVFSCRFNGMRSYKKRLHDQIENPDQEEEVEQRTCTSNTKPRYKRSKSYQKSFSA